jgi:hypothetical protein
MTIFLAVLAALIAFAALHKFWPAIIVLIAIPIFIDNVDLGRTGVLIGAASLIATGIIYFIIHREEGTSPT